MFCFCFSIEERTFPHQKQFNNILNSHGSITITLLPTLVIRFKNNAFINARTSSTVSLRVGHFASASLSSLTISWKGCLFLLLDIYICLKRTTYGKLEIWSFQPLSWGIYFITTQNESTFFHVMLVKISEHSFLFLKLIIPAAK